MKNLALILASMCIFAQATSVFQAPAFLELKKTPFGNSLTALVELNMSYAGRLDAIAEVLNTVEQTLQQRKVHNGEEIQRERGWCNDEEEKLSQNIELTAADLADHQQEQANLLNEQQDTNTSLENERQNLSSNENNLENTHSDLDNENERHAAAAADYAEAIAACDQALTLLATLRANPTGFIQSKARFGNVIVLLQKHLANKSSSFVQPVLTVLSELATSTQQLDQAKLVKVIQLIESLLNELRNQQSQNEQRHTDSVTNLTNQIAVLEDVIQKSKEAISQKETRLRDIATRLAQLEDLVAEVQNLLENFKRQLKQTEETCAGYESGFAEVETQIDQQIATLQALKDYFKSHVVPSVENVRDSAFADDLTVPL